MKDMVSEAQEGRDIELTLSEEQEPPHQASANGDQETRPQCMICYERPLTYGLLPNCNHIFCYGCLKNWRSTAPRHPNEPGEVRRAAERKKRCPLCRTPSQFIIPATVFVKNENKQHLLRDYRLALAKIACKHFERSKDEGAGGLFCPFGGAYLFRLHKVLTYVSFHGTKALPGLSGR